MTPSPIASAPAIRRARYGRLLAPIPLRCARRREPEVEAVFADVAALLVQPPAEVHRIDLPGPRQDAVRQMKDW